MKELKTIDIKGKAYVLINERIKYFKETYENGQILTEMLSNNDGVCVFKALVIINDKIVATGHAQEKEDSSFINKTSYIENCETSAVGRALGFAGIGIDTSIASYEEVQNAILNQETKITESQLNIIKEKLNEEQIEKALSMVKRDKLEELTIQEASSLIKKIK